MFTVKDYYESQKMFVKWRNHNEFIGTCLYQIYDEGVLLEKWKSYDNEKIFIVEFYPKGNGFAIYNLEK